MVLPDHPQAQEPSPRAMPLRKNVRRSKVIVNSTLSGDRHGPSLAF
ncbi:MULTISPECIES: hypothetical protein [Synechocystis]|nr:MULTISPECIES: hypothetical protein [Synechocystis]